MFNLKYKKMKVSKYKLNQIILVFTIIILSYISITSIICRFKNPEYTETQLFLRIPQSFILKF